MGHKTSGGEEVKGQRRQDAVRMIYMKTQKSHIGKRKLEWQKKGTIVSNLGLTNDLCKELMV